MRRLAFVGGLLCALLALRTADAVAQTYPSRPIKLIVAFAPGGQGDVVARVFADALSKIVKQPVVVENHGGASGTIGANLVAKGPADGYTLLAGGTSNLALAPALISKLPYDPLKDFLPLGELARIPYGLAVRSEVPTRTLAELIAYARANPGRLTYGSSGVGSNSSLAIEELKSAAGLDILHIPYEGAGPAVTALAGGQIDMVCMDLALLVPQAQAGAARLVAALGRRRSLTAPDLPTAVEQGLPWFVVEPWIGLVAPAGIPGEVYQKLAAALNQSIRSPELRRRLQQRGYEVVVDTPESFRELMRSESAKYARLVATVGIPREP